MKFVLSDEQHEVAAVAGKFLREELPLPRVRQLGEAVESGSSWLAVDDRIWNGFAAMGWFSLGVPESAGGVGCGPVEEFMLFTELGRHITPGPIASTSAGSDPPSRKGST